MFEWMRGSLGELASGVRGVSYTPNQLQRFISPETVVLLRSNNIKGGQVNFDNVQLVPSHIVSNEQLAQHGDIAVCMSNGSKALVGKSGRIEGNEAPCTVGAFCSIFRPHTHADEKFVSYIFQSGAYRRHLDIILAGSAINNLRNSDVEALSLEIPPRKEQRLIAHILDTLDTQIQKTEALIAKLEKVKEGLLHDLLIRGIDENGHLRPSPEHAPELYKESPLGLIPKEWEAVSLGEASDLQVGYAFKSSWFEDSGVYRLLRGDNVGYGEPDWSSEKFLPEKLVKRFSEYLLNEGDVVIGMDRTFTKSGAKITEIGEQDTPLLLVQRVGRFLPISGRAKNDYIKAVLASPQYLRELVQQEKGMDIPHLSKSEILSPIIPLPPFSEQEIISNIACRIDSRVRTSIMEVETLSSTKQALMDDLLTGRVRVTPLLDQSQAQTTTPA